MFVTPFHESIRFTGRWDTSDPNVLTATATGSYIEFAFEGRMAVACFDTLLNREPRLHLWVSLDGGAQVEAAVDPAVRVIAPNDGAHICRIIYKGGTEHDRRWEAPLTGKVSFLGVQTEKPLPIAPDTRKIIEFVGDSITEGVLIDTDFGEGLHKRLDTYIDQEFRCNQDDVCATYAWLTAEALNLRPVFMGYGAVGATRSGCGKVPDAATAYPFNYDGSPVTRPTPDYVVINHGANDGGATPERYVECYAKLLDVIRSMNPDAVVIALSAFYGNHHEALGQLISDYNEKNGCNVHFIDSTGWIPRSPLHPMRDGHRTVSEHLIPLIRDIINN